MTPLAITGIGLVAPGINFEIIKTAALKNLTIPAINETADTSDLNIFFQQRQLRRVDHYSKMALLAACRALLDSKKETNLDNEINVPENMGIILCSGYGPSQKTFEFLDSILDFGTNCASPLAFSHSVHNIPTAVLSQFLNLSCPYTTICQLHSPVYSALTTAACWIDEGRVEKVLLGAVDEITPLLKDNTSRIISEKDLGPNRPPVPVSEGAAFFVLTKPSIQKVQYGTIDLNIVSQEQIITQTKSQKVFAPARTLNKLTGIGIKATSAYDADMPTSAGIELIASAIFASQKGHAICIEKANNGFGIININHIN